MIFLGAIFDLIFLTSKSEICGVRKLFLTVRAIFDLISDSIGSHYSVPMVILVEKQMQLIVWDHKLHAFSQYL